MIITGLSPARSPLATRRQGSASGFRISEPAGAPDPPVAAPATEGASLMALQEAVPPLARDRAARGRCAALLAGLTRLQRALLGGSTESALADLARVASEPADAPDAPDATEAADPGLRVALAMTTLRVRIELARHNRS